MAVTGTAAQVAAVVASFLLAGGIGRHATAQAPDTTLAAAFAANRLPLAFEADSLRGAGGVLLLREAAAAQFGYTLFDLRPIRALIQNRELRDVPPALERTIFGFDVLVVLTGSRPAVE